MNKEELSSVFGGIAGLFLIYLFWFTPVKDKFEWWQKAIIWFGVVGTFYRIGYALGKNVPAATNTTLVVKA